ncbi:hypothetical protein M0R45_022045 [Rubus argutus]|uniref:Uncharacterized protein n=1 Tax=Rubus argutus TaxID=59490 RepID=A0AAW1XGQ0_RUBAR
MKASAYEFSWLRWSCEIRVVGVGHPTVGVLPRSGHERRTCERYFLWDPAERPVTVRMGWPLQRVEKREEDMLGIRPKERDREDLWQGALWVKDERKKSREASLQMPLLEQRVLQVKYNHNPIRVVSLLQIGHKGLIQRLVIINSDRL